MEQNNRKLSDNTKSAGSGIYETSAERRYDAHVCVTPRSHRSCRFAVATQSSTVLDLELELDKINNDQAALPCSARDCNQ